MPLYEYQCAQCGRFEIIQKSYADAPLSCCPTCGKEVQKLLSSPAIQFKGSGWYVTDYARKGEGAGKGEGAKEGAKGDASKESSKPADKSADSSSSSPQSSTSKDSSASGSGSSK